MESENTADQEFLVGAQLDDDGRTSSPREDDCKLAEETGEKIEAETDTSEVGLGDNIMKEAEPGLLTLDEVKNEAKTAAVHSENQEETTTAADSDFKPEGNPEAQILPGSSSASACAWTKNRAILKPRVSTSDTQIAFFSSHEFDDDSDSSSSDSETNKIRPMRFIQFSDDLSSEEEDDDDDDEEQDHDDDGQEGCRRRHPQSDSELTASKKSSSEFGCDLHRLPTRSKSEGSIVNFFTRAGYDISGGDDFIFVDWPYYYTDEVYPSYMFKNSNGYNELDFCLLRSSTSHPELTNSKRCVKLQRFSHTCSLPDLNRREDYYY